MSERDFDLYLDLLGRLLSLSAQQRAAIQDELRDDLECRFADLVAQGLPRDEAVRQALDELGDAAGLAVHFARLAKERKKRWLMRCTVLSCVGLTLCVLAAAAFWPRTDGPAAPRFMFAADGDETHPKQAAPELTNVTAADLAAERKLAEPMPAVELVETPLADVVQFISSKAEVDILFDLPATEELGIALDQPITINIQYAQPPARAILEAVLRQVSRDASYVIRDGVVWITNRYQAQTTRVYDCSDLLLIEGVARRPRSTGGIFGAAEAGKAPPQPVPADDPAAALENVIVSIVQPDSWDEVGGTGSICIYGGLMVVKQSTEAQREIDELLSMLRAATRGKVAPSQPRDDSNAK